jgi:hypothetical protein
LKPSGQSHLEPSAQREAEIVEQRGNEVEASGVPGVGLVIGTELTNPDPVSNSLFVFLLDCMQRSLAFLLCVCICLCVRMHGSLHVFTCVPIFIHVHVVCTCVI